jgi:hypothetical protein
VICLHSVQGVPVITSVFCASVLVIVAVPVSTRICSLDMASNTSRGSETGLKMSAKGLGPE